MSNPLDFWRKNADWQLAKMSKLPDDKPDGERRDKSAYFDEWVYALERLNELGERNTIPQKPEWYIASR